MASTTLLLALAGTIIPLAVAEDATIRPEDNLPQWQQESTMTMGMSTLGDVDPFDYPIVPLTETLGLNQTDTTRGAIDIEGMLVWINQDNFEKERENQAEEVAYLSCEDAENSDITANQIVNTIMATKPKAIVLYSLQSAACALEGQDLPYQSIFTFVDAGDAQKVLDILNQTNEADVIKASITGNTTDSPETTISRERGNHSAVAMSVLYSITGLITMLFLIIIAAGAIRAHRYPERYGPRSANGGRSRQSRAKGIARAVLDTIPIVKFGEPSQPKQDPALELESASGRGERDLEAAVSSSASTADARNADAAHTNTNTTVESGMGSGVTGPDAGADENLDCSICTDKFVVGEDVRVLPCSHKYHPTCIDPWLTEVSGTCPLCRLDLRDRDQPGKDEPCDESNLPPPLEIDTAESEVSSTERRRTRLFDLARLRHASPEERIQVLRQLRRDDHDSGSTSGDSSERSRRAKMTDKLRDKFRIRTRPQSPDSRRQS